MFKKVLALSFVLMATLSYSQDKKPKFGKGIVIEGENYKLKAAFRFQNLFTNEWNIRNDDFKYVEGLKSNFMVRRARLKFSGWAYTPKLKYKMELGLSNKDLSGGNGPEYKYASRMILDAYLEWNFYKNFSILVGQTKLPGNRERIVSSANMQFVDRSRLNSKFTLDRDMGVMLKHHFKIGNNFLIKEVYSFAQGEGRNVTAGAFGGFSHTFKVEFFPFGDFKSKGAYVGGDIKREETPKLAVAFAYNINNKAVRERGQKGSYLINQAGDYVGKTINTTFADMMFKYKGFSLMAEVANRLTTDHNPNVYEDDDSTLVGTYFTGFGFNTQAGYLFKSNWEIAARYTMITPQASSGHSNTTEYGLALSKYIVGHKLKVQTDLGYRQIAGKDDKLFWRVQFDIHF